MKLNYGFMCDFCGRVIEYTDKTSVKYEKTCKASNYNKVHSFDVTSAITADLCPTCAARFSRMLEKTMIFPQRKGTYLRLCHKHAKMVAKNSKLMACAENEGR